MVQCVAGILETAVGHSAKFGKNTRQLRRLRSAPFRSEWIRIGIFRLGVYRAVPYGANRLASDGISYSYVRNEDHRRPGGQDTSEREWKGSLACLPSQSQQSSIVINVQ